MCGIFGIVTKHDSNLDRSFIKKALRMIAIASISRGKDSSGMAFYNKLNRSIDVIKGDIPISDLLRSAEYKSSLDVALNSFSKGNPFAAMGHARLVTNGSQLREENNQPVIKDGTIIIHNGIIVNNEELWKDPNLKREYEIDTEVMAALLNNLLKQGNNLKTAISITLEQIRGTVSSAIMFNTIDNLSLVTNNGSLYYIQNDAYFIFASERIFLTHLNKTLLNTDNTIYHLDANKCLLINIVDLRTELFNIKDKSSVPASTLKHEPYVITKQNLKNPNSNHIIINPSVYTSSKEGINLKDLLQYNSEKINKMKRCSKCVLPQSFPYIEFDEKGVCNYCNNYVQKNQPKPIEELKKLIEPYKSKSGEVDCLVPFSGGRDSTYALHFVKKELGLNPIAFTYDWGMVTDLARRNAARVCGKLGVENIIVAADIHLKRKNINKNISAWLKKPHLGMIPLFMAGDKYFFYYSNKIVKENNLHLSIWGSSPLENTDFKAGFTGIKPNFNKKRIDELKLTNKIRLASFFGENYLGNPSYLNSSLADTFGSFASRYVIKRRGYFQLFDYIKWDEKEVDSLIINEYNWEKSIDTKSTWRIGDGTAAFYNYIYYTVAGFSEFDTFRSNQVREGQLSRETALELINEENKPRYENLRWYLDIVGLDFKNTIQIINKIPKMY